MTPLVSGFIALVFESILVDNLALEKSEQKSCSQGNILRRLDWESLGSIFVQLSIDFPTGFGLIPHPDHQAVLSWSIITAIFRLPVREILATISGELWTWLSQLPSPCSHYSQPSF
jgi:hypothetical protein